MQFTYVSYKNMLQKLTEKGFRFRNYKNWMESDRTVILRHDVDNSLHKAVILSEIEKSVPKVNATYFILVSTNFYNVHSKESRECMARIIKNGGTIGLHFDEAQYPIVSEDILKELVNREIDILSDIIDTKVDVISMHRPSERMISKNMEFDGSINAYSDVYFKQMKYLSDSRRHWRENIEKIIEEKCYRRLHILTHPFWYVNGPEKNLKQTLKEAILNAAIEYYNNMENNFRDLDHEITRTEIERVVYR